MNTREHDFAAQVEQLRAMYPTMSDSYWRDMEARERLQWKVDDLREGIARLAGKYQYHAEQTGNALLAEMVNEVMSLLRGSVGSVGQENPQ